MDDTKISTYCPRCLKTTTFNLVSLTQYKCVVCEYSKWKVNRPQ